MTDLLPADEWAEYTEPLVAFKASVDKVWSGRGMGEMYMTLRVPMEFKHDALALSDTVGLIFKVATWRRPRLTRQTDTEAD